MSIECNFCKHQFLNRSSLNQHQKRTKYCLKIQGENKKTQNLYNCDYCKNDFTSKQNYTYHISSCKKNQKNDIEYYIKKNKELEDIIENNKLKHNKNIEELKLNYIIENNILKKELEIYKQLAENNQKSIIKIAEQPKTTTNNSKTNILNLPVFNITDEQIKTIFDEKFSKEHFLNGQMGVACFTYSNILKNSEEGDDKIRYSITDRSRCNAKYKTETGEVVVDKGMQGLTTKVYPHAKAKSSEIFDDTDKSEQYINAYIDICSLQSDNTSFNKQIMRMITS